MSATDVSTSLSVGHYHDDARRQLTGAQRDAYFLLITDYWRNSTPPADEAVLTRIAALELAAGERHAPMLRRFFQVEDRLSRSRYWHDCGEGK